MNFFSCARFVVVNRIWNSGLLNVPEGVDVGIVLPGGVDVQSHGVALGDGEVALLIIGIEVGTALGLEGLGGACQAGAGGGVRDLGVGALCIFVLVVDGVLLQHVGAPLAIDLHILFDRHVGEVKGLFHAVFHVEPAHKGVAAVGGFFGNRISLGTMGNGDIRMRRELGASVQCGLVQVEGHSVIIGYPLGIKNQIT